MKRALLAISVVAFTATAHADPVQLGGITLGAPLKGKKTRPATVLGCEGTVSAQLVKKKVARVTFMADDPECLVTDDGEIAQAVGAAVDRGLMPGVKPVENGFGNLLWEGSTTSLLFTPADTMGMPLTLSLVPAVAAGTHRNCFPGDGFDEFHAQLKALLEVDQSPTALAAMFKFPFKSYGYAWKNVAAFEKKAAKDFLTEGNLQAFNESAFCRIDTGDYIFLFHDINLLIVATRTSVGWRFTGLDERPMY